MLFGGLRRYPTPVLNRRSFRNRLPADLGNTPRAARNLFKSPDRLHIVALGADLSLFSLCSKNTARRD